jgi:hypothetical protein
MGVSVGRPEGSPPTKEPTPGREAVVTQLERLLASRDFDAPSRCRFLLRFLVEETLAGRETLLSERTIAARVFRRNGDFDPDLDPIVWLQAGRLRRSLARFYRGAGAADPVLIELPRTTYVPVVRRSASPRDGAAAAPTRLLART